MGSNWKMKCLDSVVGYSTKDKYVCRDGYAYNSKGERIVKFKTFNSLKEILEYYSAKQELIINEISTKEELEDGDICVLRNGKKAVFFEDCFFMKYGISARITYSYNSGLTNLCDDKDDIMEVYRNKELVYKREEQLKVGDEVIIIDNGEIYSTPLPKWFDGIDIKYCLRFAYEILPPNSKEKKFKIVAIINTSYGDGYLIYDRAKTFLIGEKGIKKL